MGNIEEEDTRPRKPGTNGMIERVAEAIANGCHDFSEESIPGSYIPASAWPAIVRAAIAAMGIEALIAAAKLAHHEMRHTSAPRDSFTDALDALDAALFPPPSGCGRE